MKKLKHYTDKKIVFIISSFSKGGAERVMTTLCNEFARQGYPLEILLTTNIPATYKVNNGIRVIPVYSEKKSRFRFIDKLSRMRKYMKANSDCTYVAFLPYDTAYTYIAGIGLKLRLICSLRNDPKHFQKLIHKFVYKIVYPSAAHVVFQTEDAKAYFPEKVKKKSAIISNPVTEVLPPVYKGERDKEFVAVGRLIGQKNYPMMLQAYAKVRSIHPEWKLRIFGTGAREQEFRTLAESLGISESVIFEGFVENVPEKIRKAGAFLMTSDFEGISNAMLEALALGLPTICTDCPVGGPKMYIRDGVNGFLCPVGDTETFAQKMLDLIEYPDTAKAMTENLKNFRQELSVSEIAEQWKKVLWN